MKMDAHGRTDIGDGDLFIHNFAVFQQSEQLVTRHCICMCGIEQFAVRYVVCMNGMICTAYGVGNPAVSRCESWLAATTSSSDATKVSAEVGCCLQQIRWLPQALTVKAVTAMTARRRWLQLGRQAQGRSSCDMELVLRKRKSMRLSILYVFQTHADVMRTHRFGAVGE